MILTPNRDQSHRYDVDVAFTATPVAVTEPHGLTGPQRTANGRHCSRWIGGDRKSARTQGARCNGGRFIGKPRPFQQSVQRSGQVAVVRTALAFPPRVACIRMTQQATGGDDRGQFVMAQVGEWFRQGFGWQAIQIPAMAAGIAIGFFSELRRETGTQFCQIPLCLPDADVDPCRQFGCRAWFLRKHAKDVSLSLG